MKKRHYSRRDMLGMASAALAPAALFSPMVAGAQSKTKMRIGTHASISAHLFMRKKPELLKHLGKTYDIEWVNFSGGGEALPALVSGNLDGCLATPFPFANAINKSRVPITIVHQLLSMGFDGHYDDFTVVRTDGGVDKIEDLKGKIFGVNAIGGTNEQAAKIIAKKHGLDPNRDITFVEGRPPFLPTLLKNKKIDAATLFQPFYNDAMAKGDVKKLYSTSDVYGGPTDYVFMVFSEKYLNENRNAVKAYIEDYLIAVNWALDNRSEAVKIYSEQWKLPLEIVDSYLLTKSDYLVRRDGSLSIDRIQPIISTLAEAGFISNLDLSKHFDISLLPK